MKTTKIKVKAGTIHFEEGTFEQGSIITVSEERLKQFNPGTFEILAEPATAESTVSSPETTTKPSTSEPQTTTSEPETTTAPKPKKRRLSDAI